MDEIIGLVCRVGGVSQSLDRASVRAETFHDAGDKDRCDANLDLLLAHIERLTELAADIREARKVQS